MGFPSSDEITSAVARLSNKEGVRIGAAELWPALAFLRYRRLNGGGQTFTLNSFDLSEVIFDLVGIRLPIELKASQTKAFFTPASAGAKRWAEYFKNGESPRNTFLNKIQSLVERGPRQLPVFKQSAKELPVVVELEADWLSVLKSNPAIAYICDTQPDALLTWLFRYGVPKDAANSTSPFAKQEERVLRRREGVTASSIPEGAAQIRTVVSDFFGLSESEVLTLIPSLSSIAAIGSASKPIAIEGFADILEKAFTDAETPLPRDATGGVTVESRDFVISWELFSTRVIETCPVIGVGAAVRDICSALKAGKFVILYGAPGTGKSELASFIATTALEFGCPGVSSATATAEWSTFETMGGYSPDPAQPTRLEFTRGVISESLYTGKWLLIDEINRADFDKAFGELFTLFSAGKVQLPFRDVTGKAIVLLPRGFDGPLDEDTETPIRQQPDWRMLGTMNSADKTSLFQFSYAFMRRFAFVEVPVPNDAGFRQILERRALALSIPEAAAFRDTVLQLLCAVFCSDNGLRKVHSSVAVGPAIPLDILDFIAARLALLKGESATPILARSIIIDGLKSYFFPQLEGRESDHAAVVSVLAEVFTLSDSERLETDRAIRHWTNARL